VIGKDPTAVEAIWRDLWRASLTYGRGGIAMMALSALDIALWDAVGKRAGLPLHRLWGHFRSQIRGSGGDGMIAKAHHYVSQGFKAIKMQVAHVHDLANVRRMREALGLDIDIMIDVNQQVRELRHVLARGAGAARRLCRLSPRRASARPARRRQRARTSRPRPRVQAGGAERVSGVGLARPPPL
jgi:L-alanine-DL-glutamate epimerase-like enolase superfamily enzyme